ncbi:S8 family serine peptidase [Pedobacter sp. MW01-1-1]|uniref:S8 family serine peptidase n=1 Tax=Pedobacter sp. MW01-1-1 TaxID=3383027 RepID=UPI003FEF24A6
MGQVVKDELDGKFRIYVLQKDMKLVSARDSLLLVEFNAFLSPEEINKINPKRQLSRKHFIVNPKNIGLITKQIKNKWLSNNLWKASDNLIQRWQHDKKKRKEKLIKVVFDNSFQGVPTYLEQYKVQSVNKTYKVIVLYLPLSDLEAILNHSQILFADIVQSVEEEIVVNGMDMSAVNVSSVRNIYSDLNGENITISLKEGGFDYKDLDLLGKVIPNVNSSPDNGHAIIMATLALGSGNSFINGEGVAPAAKLITSDFVNLLPDDINELSLAKVTVQNHSYGVGLDNSYGLEAQLYDYQVYYADTIVHVFSSGNKGNTRSSNGLYQNIENMANLTGNFKQAKNVLVVGGINRENIVEPLSSKGPAYDGRVKPDFVSLGEDGTSGAAALTTGIVSLLQQKYYDIFGKRAPSALIKSVLVNSADDLGRKNVDYSYGFGKVNALKAINTIVEKRFIEEELIEGQDFLFPIQIKQEQKEFKITLVWNDLPALINSAQSIVNHLDLSVEDLNGEIVLPWVLSTFPDIDSLKQPAVRRIDQINNVQQVSLENLLPGTYIVHVKGRKVTQDKQVFYLAYEMSLPNHFSFTFPGKNDYVFAGKSNYVRWESNYENKTGKLFISYDNGGNWSNLSPSVNLSANFFKWNSPNAFGRARLKMEIGEEVFKGGSFIISSPPILKVGYNCEDSILFYWKAQPLAKNYTIYTMVDNNLTFFRNTIDTMILVKKNPDGSPYFALSENGTDFNGLKSYTIDYQNQGISCYTVSLNGDVEGDAVRLNLNIGTTYKLKSFIWEKQIDSETFIPLKVEYLQGGLLQYSIIDLSPKTGIQRYRVTFLTKDSKRIQSNVISIKVLKKDDIVVYPNPVSTDLKVLSGAYYNYSLVLFDAVGRKVFEKIGNGDATFNLTKLGAGLYLGVIFKNKQPIKKIKIIKN